MRHLPVLSLDRHICRFKDLEKLLARLPRATGLPDSQLLGHVLEHAVLQVPPLLLDLLLVLEGLQLLLFLLSELVGILALLLFLQHRLRGDRRVMLPLGLDHRLLPLSLNLTPPLLPHESHLLRCPLLFLQGSLEVPGDLLLLHLLFKSDLVAPLHFFLQLVRLFFLSDLLLCARYIVLSHGFSQWLLGLFLHFIANLVHFALELGQHTV